MTPLCVLAALGLAGPGDFEDLRLYIEVDLPSVPLGTRTIDFSSLAAELSFEARAPVALRELCILEPNGAEAMRLLQPNKTVSTREMSMELEGGSLSTLKAEYPEGWYRVEALTVKGELVTGSVRLEHKLPGPFAVLGPDPGVDVPFGENVTVAWTPSAGATRYLLEVENDLAEFSINLALPPSQTRFTLPGSLLVSSGEYDISLTVEGDTDNQLEFESRFTMGAQSVTSTEKAAD